MIQIPAKLEGKRLVGGEAPEGALHKSSIQHFQDTIAGLKSDWRLRSYHSQAEVGASLSKHTQIPVGSQYVSTVGHNHQLHDDSRAAKRVPETYQISLDESSSSDSSDNIVIKINMKKALKKYQKRSRKSAHKRKHRRSYSSSSSSSSASSESQKAHKKHTHHKHSEPDQKAAKTYAEPQPQHQPAQNTNPAPSAQPQPQTLQQPAANPPQYTVPQGPAGSDIVPVQILKQDVITTSQKIVIKPKAVKDKDTLPKPLLELGLKVTNKTLTAAQKTQVCHDFGDAHAEMSFYKVMLTEKGKATDFLVLDKKFEDIAHGALKLFIYEGDPQHPGPHTVGGIYWVEDKKVAKMDNTLFVSNSLVIQKEGEEQKEVIQALKSCLKAESSKEAAPPAAK